MADNGKDKKLGCLIPITVAVIGLLGALGSALISNWDKILPRNNPDHQTVSDPVDPKKQFTIVGTWLVYEPNVENPLTSITLSQDNQYQGGSWGKDFQYQGESWFGANSSNEGLGADQYSFDGEVLSFNLSKERVFVPVDESSLIGSSGIMVISYSNQRSRLTA